MGISIYSINMCIHVSFDCLCQSNPDEPVWLGEVVFDADDNVTEKVKQKSPAKRIAGLTSPAAKSEKDTIFNNCFALLEVSSYCSDSSALYEVVSVEPDILQIYYLLVIVNVYVGTQY